MNKIKMKDFPYRSLTVNVIVSCFIFALGINLIGTGIAQKVYYIASYIGILLLIIAAFKQGTMRDKFSSSNQLLPFLGSIVLLGALFMIWSFQIRSQATLLGGGIDDNSQQIIKSYYVSGTRLLLSATAILFIFQHNKLIRFETIVLGKAMLTVCLCIAVYKGWIEYHDQHAGRIKLYTPAASILSYMVIFLYCAYLSLSLTNYGKVSAVWDLLITVLVGALLLMADTRITQLAFISTFLLYLLINPTIRKKINLKTACSLVFILIVVMGSLTAKRWQEGLNDIKGFHQNSSSSLGARVAIWHAAWFFIKAHHGFSSPAERTEQARRYIGQYYPDNHEGYTNSQYNMHNEILEITTLFGLVGSVALALFYLSAYWVIIRHRLAEGTLLTVTALFICGLSDSVLWYHQSVLVLALALSISFMGNKTTNNLR